MESNSEIMFTYKGKNRLVKVYPVYVYNPVAQVFSPTSYEVKIYNKYPQSLKAEGSTLSNALKALKRVLDSKPSFYGYEDK